jgi:hypothetical protein
VIQNTAKTFSLSVVKEKNRRTQKYKMPWTVKSSLKTVRNVNSPGRISGSVSRSETRPDRGRLPCMAVGPLSRSATIKGEASRGTKTNVRRAHSAPTNSNT